jgi:hypothetical protein
MKYWTELMQLEDASIQLESAVATFKAVNCGIHQLSTEEMEMAYWNVEKQLTDLGLCWDQLIMGITSGVRVLINDKLTSSNEDRAVSVNIFTNEGFVKQNWSKYKL